MVGAMRDSKAEAGKEPMSVLDEGESQVWEGGSGWEREARGTEELSAGDWGTELRDDDAMVVSAWRRCSGSGGTTARGFGDVLFAGAKLLPEVVGATAYASSPGEGLLVPLSPSLFLSLSLSLPLSSIAPACATHSCICV